MNRKVSVLLVVSLLMFSLDLPSKERRGAELVVTKNDGQVLKGELIAVKPDSLLLISPAGKDESVGVADIATIRIVKKSKAWQGLLYGFVPGAVGGAVWGGVNSEMPWFGALIGGLVFGAATGLVGLAVGVGVGLDPEIRLSGLPESELTRILAKLDGQARKPGVYVPTPVEPTVTELGIKPARPGHEWKRFKLTWLPGFRVGGQGYHFKEGVVQFRFTEDLPPGEAGPYSSTQYWADNYPQTLSLGCVMMAYQWSRKLAVEVELYVTKYKTEHLADLHFTSTINGVEYWAVFGSDEAVSSTSLLFGLTFKPLASASLQPHVIEIGAAAGPAWIRTSVELPEWERFGDITVGQMTKWTARARVSYDYHFTPAFSIGVFGEYRWLQADVPSYGVTQRLDFRETESHDQFIWRTTEVTLPARTITMGGVACGLKFGFAF